MEQVAAQPGTKAEQGWDAAPDDPVVNRPSVTPVEIAEWRTVRAEVREAAREQNWSMGEAARRSGVPGGTLSPWYAGRWKGIYATVTGDVKRWLAAYSEQREASLMLMREPDYVETPTATKVMTSLIYAQALGGMAIVTLGSGMGKTAVVKQVLRTRPHTWHITMSPASRKVPAMLRALSSAVNTPTAHPGQLEMLIGEKLQRNGRQTLLMVDEAQYLDDDAVNQLRKFNDVNECGIVLLGNDEAYQRWGAAKPKVGYGQLHSRFDDRVRILKPLPGDIEMYVAAWGISDPAVVKLLVKIGHQPGALRQINKTIRIAGTIAGPKGRQIAAEDVAQAWARRSGGEIL